MWWSVQESKYLSGRKCHSTWTPRNSSSEQFITIHLIFIIFKNFCNKTCKDPKQSLSKWIYLVTLRNINIMVYWTFRWYFGCLTSKFVGISYWLIDIADIAVAVLHILLLLKLKHSQKITNEQEFWNAAKGVFIFSFWNFSVNKNKLDFSHHLIEPFVLLKILTEIRPLLNHAEPD